MKKEDFLPQGADFPPKKNFMDVYLPGYASGRTCLNHTCSMGQINVSKKGNIRVLKTMWSQVARRLGSFSP